MINSPVSLADNKALILSSSVLCKDYFSLAEINRFFIYAGADESWKDELESVSTSQRMDRVNEWVSGIRRNAPEELANTIIGSVSKMILNEYDPDNTESGILREIIDGDHMVNAVLFSRQQIVPHGIEELLEIIIYGLPRAKLPLAKRRSGKPAIRLADEYDVQDLFNALLQPWVKDIRAEEYTPSYAGTSTRMDFLLNEHKIVCEIKFVRDDSHAKKVGDELIIDIAHYRQHPNCETLYAIIYDASELIRNPDGLQSDIESQSDSLDVKVFIIPKRTLQ